MDESHLSRCVGGRLQMCTRHHTPMHACAGEGGAGTHEADALKPRSTREGPDLADTGRSFVLPDVRWGASVRRLRAGCRGLYTYHTPAHVAAVWAPRA